MGKMINPNQTLDDLLHSLLNEALVSVNAPSGSLMKFDEIHATLHIKSRLGPPSADRKEEPIFWLSSKKGIASKVASEKKAYICNDVSADNNFLKIRKKQPVFKSLLSVPIILNKKLFGVINADHSKSGHFEKTDISKVNKVLNTYLPVISERIDLLQALANVSSQLTRQYTISDMREVLNSIADNIRSALGADIVILYQYDMENDRFLTENKGPTISGNLKHPQYMLTEVEKRDVPYDILKGGSSRFIPGINNEKIFTERVERARLDRDRFCKRERIASLAALPLASDSMREKEFVGVMFVNYKKKHIFYADEQNAIESFARAAAATILNTRREDKYSRIKTGLYDRIRERARSILLKKKSFLARFNNDNSNSFVFAVDIRKSTELMLRATRAENYVKFISELEKKLNDIIKSNFGIIDKFTGDGILAYFPTFYSGQEAGLFAVKSALECHEAFENIFRNCRDCFHVSLVNTGLGIGIDYGEINLNLKGQELIAVGIPVVYANRLSSIDAHCTVMNEQAYRKILEIESNPVEFKEITLSLKNEGECFVYKISNKPVLTVTDPDWCKIEDDRSHAEPFSAGDEKPPRLTN